MVFRSDRGQDGAEAELAPPGPGEEAYVHIGISVMPGPVPTVVTKLVYGYSLIVGSSKLDVFLMEKNLSDLSQGRAIGGHQINMNDPN